MRLNIVVEGQAEETYINEILSLHLVQFDVGAVARRVEFSRRKQRIVSRGGLFDYPKLKRDVTNWLKQDREALVTTMVDLYYLPSDFPKRGEAKKITNPFQKVALLESAFAEDVDSGQFIPNIQLHEFEPTTPITQEKSPTSKQRLTGMLTQRRSMKEQQLHPQSGFSNMCRSTIRSSEGR